MKGATATLYLDFGGHSSTTDYWAKQTSARSYTVPPIDLSGAGFDGNPAEFSPAEQLLIYNAWRVTSEDFAPFNLNVSTDYHGGFGLATGFDMVISNSNGSIFGVDSQTLGLAPLATYATGFASVNVGQVFLPNHSGTFGDDSDNSVRIVGIAKELGDTISHEFGHALGLNHYVAANAQPNAIMSTAGVGLAPALWRAVPGFQDDMAIIGSAQNKIGFRPDDYANTLQGAFALTGMGGNYAANGIIEQPADIDTFRFSAAGLTTITASVDPYVNDLNPRLRLYDSSGKLIALGDNASGIAASITQSLVPGTYYVDVRGNGSPGDAGRYALSVSTTSTADIPPTIALGVAATPFLQGGGSVLLDTSATITDPDSPVFQNGTLTVSISANGTPSDRLAVLSTGAVAVRGATVTVGGVPIGTLAGGTDGSTPLVIALNANATQDATQQLVRAIGFDDEAAVLSIAPRTIQFVLTDGNGGTSAPVSKSVDLTAVNAPPVLVIDAPLVVSMGQSGSITNNLLQVADPDTPPSRLTFMLQTLPVHGSLLLAGGVLSVGSTFTQEDVNLGRLIYVQGANRAATDSFTFLVTDGAGGQTGPAIFNIVINPFGPPPMLVANTGLRVSSRSVTPLTPAVLQAADPVGDPASLVYHVVAGPGARTLANGTGGTPIVQFSQAQIDQGEVAYLAPDANGTNSTSFTFTVQNSQGITIGPFAFPITVALVKQGPAIPTGVSPPPLNVTYENDGNSSGTLVTELLASYPGLTGIAVVGVDTSEGGWQFTTDGQTWTDLGTVSDHAARLLAADSNTLVRFVPVAGFTGVAGITFRAWDSASGPNGGIGDTTIPNGQAAFSTTTATAIATVAPIDLPPSFQVRSGPDGDDCLGPTGHHELGFADSGCQLLRRAGVHPPQ